MKIIGEKASVIFLMLVFFGCGVDKSTEFNGEIYGLSHSNGFSNCDYEVDVLKGGGEFHGANGVRFDSSGVLHVASVFGRTISAIDSGGNILQTYDASIGVDSPDDLAFGPDGSMYWTDTFAGTVGKRTPDGVVSVIASIGPGVNPIAFSSNGRLIVGRMFTGVGLYEIDPNGIAAPRVIDATAMVNGFDFGPDGKLYGPEWFTGSIVKYDIDNGVRTVLATGLGVPSAVKFDKLGRLHAVLVDSGKLVRVDTTTGTVSVVAVLPDPPDNLDFDSQNNAWISSNEDGSIVKVSTNRGRAHIRRITPSGMTAPSGIVLDQTGNLLVADFYSIRRFKPNSGKQISVSRSTIGITAQPTAFSASRFGDKIIMTEWFTNQVFKYDPVTLQVFDSTSYAVPTNAIEFRGDALVAQLGDGTVVRDTAGVRTVVASGLYYPVGLASDGNSAWVADWATGIIYKFIENQQSLPSPVPVVSGLVAPEGMAIDRDGTILVAEVGTGSIVRINPTTGARSTIASNLSFGLSAAPGLAPHMVTTGITVAKDGTIYVTSDLKKQIYKIHRCKHCRQ